MIKHCFQSYVFWAEDFMAMLSLAIIPTVLYLICKFQRPLNYKHDKNFAEIPIEHNLLHAFFYVIDNLYISKKPFSSI